MTDYGHLWKLATSFKIIVSAEFPDKNGKVGRPRMNLQNVFWMTVRMLHKGWTWREIPYRFGSRSTLHDWFQKLVEKRVFERIWEEALRIKWKNKELQLGIQSIDTTTILAPGLTGDQAKRSYRYKPKRAIKLSCLVDQKGVPIAMISGGANDHDSTLLESTLKSKPKMLKTGTKPMILGDKAYTGDLCLEVAKSFGYQSIFIPRDNESRQLSARELNTVKKVRWVIERTFAWLKAKKKLTLCREHKLKNYLGFVYLALAIIVDQA